MELVYLVSIEAFVLHGSLPKTLFRDVSCLRRRSIQSLVVLRVSGLSRMPFEKLRKCQNFLMDELWQTDAGLPASVPLLSIA
jgi:hypothetical protein